MSRLVCPRCSRAWDQRGNLTGHCGQCHETWSSLRSFDDHQRIEQGKVICLDPRTTRTRTGKLRWKPFLDACGATVWRGNEEFPVHRFREEDA